MASTSLSIKYRPIQIGFLVRHGSLEDLSKAIGLNTMLWGGVFNPIIPIKPNELEAAQKLIELYSVDVLYAVSSSPEIEEIIKKYPFLRDPGHYAENIFYEDWHTKKKVMGYLDSKNLVDYYWTKEFKDKPKEYKSSFLLPHWEKDDPLASIFEVLFGYFPKFPGIEFKYNYEEVFIKGLRASDFVIAKTAPITFNPFTRHTPLITTAFNLSGYPRGYRSNGHGIYIGKSSDFDDLVNFWNLRASGLKIWFHAVDVPERTLPAVKEYLASLDKLANKNPNWEDYLEFYYRINDEQVKTIIDSDLKTTKRAALHHLSEHSWNGFNIQPARFLFDWQRVNADVDKSFGKERVNIQLPPKKFLGDNEDDIDKAHQQLAVTIDAFSDLNYSGLTLRPPFLPELNEFYSREIAIDPWHLRSDEDGVSYLTNVNDTSITLFPLPYKTLIEKLFEIKGLKAKTSQAGLLTNKIIDKLGDLEEGRVLKIAGVRKLLEGKKADVQNTTDPLTGQKVRTVGYIKTDFIDKKEAMQTIGVLGFNKHKKLFIEQRDSPELTPDQVFNYLLRREVFRAGLEIICEECKLKSWLSLTQLDNIWICEYCGASNKTTIQLITQGEWKFRKNGLFAKDNNQEGAIPVILTLLTLKRVIDNFNFMHTTSLKIDGNGINCETDLSVLEYKKNSSIEIAIGECKSEKGEITDEDCANMSAVADSLSAGKQIKPYIIFAKTADTFSDEEVGRFQKMHIHGYSLILLTNKEMEPYHIYWENEGGTESDVPEKYPHSLSDLSRNSYARYLKTKPQPAVVEKIS